MPPGPSPGAVSPLDYGIVKDGPETAPDEGRDAELALRVQVYVPAVISAPIVYQDGAAGW